jgi:hypothetical protein
MNRNGKIARLPWKIWQKLKERLSEEEARAPRAPGDIRPKPTKMKIDEALRMALRAILGSRHLPSGRQGVQVQDIGHGCGSGHG